MGRMKLAALRAWICIIYNVTSINHSATKMFFGPLSWVLYPADDPWLARWLIEFDLILIHQLTTAMRSFLDCQDRQRARLAVGG